MDCVKIGDLVDGRFRVKKVVGAGSFAWVFVAEDLHSGQTVALKMLRPERFGDEDTLRRFESRELRLLERIDEFGHSPHVVRILEKRLLRHDGLPFLVLEYIDGPSLKEWLAEKEKLDIKEAARIGAGLAKGLSVIHAAGGVHRDLKPSNVRMRNGKTPVLVDLGIARALWETQKLTQGIAPMTLRYAAPEQREGLPATSAADVYALGVCLHEMFGDQNKIPRRLDKLISACLENDPQKRPAMRQIVQTLDDFARSRPSRPSLWPSLFLAGCAVFPGGTIRLDTSAEALTCIPFGGLVRQKVYHEATSADTTFKWTPIDTRGQIGRSVSGKLPNVDPLAWSVIDDGVDGHYEVLGWFGETCRHFAVQACQDRASVRELEPCDLPRPASYGKAAQLWGDINGDDVDDIMMYRQLPAIPEKPVSIQGTTLLRQRDGSSQLIKNSFDLSAIDAYHMDVPRRTGDIDRDGCADIVVATYPTGGVCSSSIYVLYGDCTGKFVLSDDVAFVPFPANLPDIGDVDEDGFLDLVTGPDDDGDPGQTFLLRGNGHAFGEAEESIDAYPDIENGRDLPGFGAVVLEDVNGDGHLDLILNVLNGAPGGGNAEYLQSVHLGHGDGTFDETPMIFGGDAKTYGGIGFLPRRGR